MHQEKTKGPTRATENTIFNIVVLTKLDLDCLLRTFDINAVKVGVTFVPMTNTLLVMWNDSLPEFTEFRKKQILEIIEFGRLTRPVASIFRLLEKSQNMKMPFVPPDLTFFMDGQYLDHSSIEKYKQLRGTQLAFLQQTFEVIRSNRYGRIKYQLQKRK